MEFLLMTEELRYYKLKYEMTKRLEDLVIKKGYMQIEPQFFEEYDSFIQMNKRIKKEGTVKLLDLDGRILILRPDITTSIIKHVIPKWEENRELKLFYLSTTFSRNQKGAIEEKKQFGIEYLGDSSMQADLEVLKLGFSMLKTFGIEFIAEINNNRFLNNLLEELGFDEEKSTQFKTIIYYKNQDALNQFIKDSNIALSNQTLLKSILKYQGSISDIKSMLKGISLSSQLMDAIDELEFVSKSLDKEDIKYARFDLSAISQYDYYAGITFKIYIEGTSNPIMSGGRYDLLTKRLGKDIPAVGFTLNSADILKEVLKNYE
ncbi:MAG: ATP phosphoribosyltransferase regulatory subunit [Tenericutes bacterium HGW-Tenericutes-2]|jgi:ATP phosphoribosyltransferase regulatory subunit|nr:MAG: ATP phosphoribosyltransferase regulatory subunit [Tenericutes bacterium HGW-Tenericutes-2]